MNTSGQAASSAASEASAAASIPFLRHESAGLDSPGMGVGNALVVVFLLFIYALVIVSCLKLRGHDEDERAFRASTQPEEAPPDSDDYRFRRFRRQPKRPGGPRRGDHGPDALPVPDCPPGGRTRILTPPAPVRAAARRDPQRGSAEPARN